MPLVLDVVVEADSVAGITWGMMDRRSHGS